MRLAGNRYTLSPVGRPRGRGADVVDVREDLASLLVHATRTTGGVVDLEQVFDLEARMTAAGAAHAGAFAPTEERTRFWALTWTLAVTDWKLRFYGSVLGYFWSLARPFLLFGVIYLVFSEFAKLGDDVPHYPVYILFALVLFQFFAEIDEQRADARWSIASTCCARSASRGW